MVLGIVYCQVHDHLAQIFVFLDVVHLKNVLFDLWLLFPVDLADIRVLFKQKSWVQQLALVALHELPSHAFLHMDGKHAEIHHFPALCARNQIQRIRPNRALLDLRLGKSFRAGASVDVEASGDYLSATEGAGTCVLLHL